MKSLNSALSIIILMAASSSLAFVKPSLPQIQSQQESLAENIVYKGSATKPSDLTTKATYRLELSVVGLSDIKLPSCTATLISRDILLTAAHCLNATNNEVIYFVKTSAGGSKTQTYKVVDMAVHEGYQKLSGATGAISVHDIALVKLDRPIVGGIPAQLPKKNWLPTSVDSVLVAGYGDNGLPAKSKEELLKDPRVIALQQEIKNNPQMSEADQMRIYGDLFNIASEKPLLWTRSKAKMVNKEGSPMKLMQLSGGQSVCSGDSGGPSFARSANSGLMVVGVHSTSTNADCGSSGSLFWKRDLPGYDTFVPYYIDWIQSNAAKLRN